MFSFWPWNFPESFPGSLSLVKASCSWGEAELEILICQARFPVQGLVTAQWSQYSYFYAILQLNKPVLKRLRLKQPFLISLTNMFADVWALLRSKCIGVLSNWHCQCSLPSELKSQFLEKCMHSYGSICQRQKQTTWTNISFLQYLWFTKTIALGNFAKQELYFSKN